MFSFSAPIDASAPECGAAPRTLSSSRSSSNRNRGELDYPLSTRGYITCEGRASHAIPPVINLATASLLAPPKKFGRGLGREPGPGRDADGSWTRPWTVAFCARTRAAVRCWTEALVYGDELIIQEKSVEYDPDRKVVLFRRSPVLVLVMPGPGNKARSPHITVATCRCRFRATILTLALDAAAQQGTMKIYSSSFRHAPLHGNTPPKSDSVNEGEPRASKRPKSCHAPLLSSSRLETPLLESSALLHATSSASKNQRGRFESPYSTYSSSPSTSIDPIAACSPADPPQSSPQSPSPHVHYFQMGMYHEIFWLSFPSTRPSRGDLVLAEAT
ncbi:hypothetical protein K438DRAFT_1773955 [Mycena galopus ATCC 62051]|nr:hypothetical protein K438DRAFT_1773955 [Mycena galopus ATCC 62051]